MSTATMSITREQAQVFDNLRSRLSALNKTLADTSQKITERDPLPPPHQMATLQSSLAFTLSQLNETMTLSAQMLKEAHVYPTSSFPGHKAGDVLEGLLRKKLQPFGEEWVGEYTTHYRSETEGEGRERDEVEEELWAWARGCSQGIVAPMLEEDAFGGDFTMAEMEEGVENVRTGLKRKLWEDDSGDEDDEDGGEQMEDVMPEKKAEVEEAVDPEAKPLPLESLLRFMTTGAMSVLPNR